MYIEANVDQIRVALHQFEDPSSVNLVFTAHSIPESMAVNCDYAAQLAEAGGLMAGALGIKSWQLVYQSRSGSPSQPWLGPDVNDHLRTLHSEGVRSVVIAPIGFVSDHMEVVYDLDIEVQKVAGELGMKMVRAATAGTHPAFVKMIRELMLERVENRVPENICEQDCCLVS
jgi:ferrochelatase